jgi:hypothetical protein
MRSLTCITSNLILFFGLGTWVLAAEPVGPYSDLSPPTFEFDEAAAASHAKLPGVTASFTTIPAAAEQSIVNDLLDLRSRIGGVAGSSSRFQAELVRLIDADRQRAADPRAASKSIAKLSAAATEPPKLDRVHSGETGKSETGESSRRAALQIAMFRALAEELDALANQLEREESFTAADALRQRGMQLREQARGLWTSFPAAREALRALPPAASSIDLGTPAAAASLPSVPAPIPDPPEPKSKGKR